MPALFQLGPERSESARCRSTIACPARWFLSGTMVFVGHHSIALHAGRLLYLRAKKRIVTKTTVRSNQPFERTPNGRKSPGRGLAGKTVEIKPANKSTKKPRRDSASRRGPRIMSAQFSWLSLFRSERQGLAPPTQFRRRRIPTSPTKPKPSSDNEPGSGTAVTVPSTSMSSYCKPRLAAVEPVALL